MKQIATLINSSPWIDDILYQDETIALVTSRKDRIHRILYLVDDVKIRCAPFEPGHSGRFNTALQTAENDGACITGIRASQYYRRQQENI